MSDGRVVGDEVVGFGASELGGGVGSERTGGGSIGRGGLAVDVEVCGPGCGDR